MEEPFIDNITHTPFSVRLLVLPRLHNKYNSLLHDKKNFIKLRIIGILEQW
jgi:predicted deacetylase